MYILQIAMAGLVLLGLGIVIFTRNIVHATYALALILLAVAGVYVLCSAELAAVVQIMLYAGGVIILLVFGVMMTSRQRGQKLMSKSKNTLLAILVSGGFFSVVVATIWQENFSVEPVLQPADQVHWVGISLLTNHLLEFELIAVILLVALVGSSYLAKMSSDE